MGNSIDPAPRKLAPGTKVAFHYGRRVVAFVVLGALGFLVVTRSGEKGDWLRHDTHLQVWIWLLVLAGLATLAAALFTRAELRDQDAARVAARHRGVVAMRWVALVATALVTAHFGSTARLTGHRVNIVQIELGSHSTVAAGCDCPQAILHAIDRDYLFIVSYMLLLGLVAFWAGAYFRLQVLRRLRVTMAAVAVVAGVFDYAEDLMMRLGTDRIVHGQPPRELLWQVAAICAWAKFALLLAVVVYALAGAFAWWATPRWVRLASWVLPEDARETGKPQAAVRTEGPPPAAPTATVSEVDQLTPHPETKRVESAPTTLRSLGGAFRMSRSSTPPATPALGIALAGGGIRASSISLGALQILDHETEALGWDGASTVTAVSGGSNMASGWSIARSSYACGPQGGNPDRIQPDVLDPPPWTYAANGEVTPEERHLVDNLGYLLTTQPRGSGTDPAAPDSARRDTPDTAAADAASYRPAVYATVISGLTVNTLVLLSMLWLITRPVGWALRGLTGAHGKLDKGAPHALVRSHHLAAPGLTFLVVGFAFLLLWVLVGTVATGAAKKPGAARVVLQTLRAISYGALGAGAVLLVALWGYVELVGLVAHASLAAVISAIGGSLGVIGTVVRILRQPAARFAPMLGGVVFLVVGLCLAALATWTAAEYGMTRSAFTPQFWHWHFDWSSGWNWVAVFLVLIGVQLWVSPERWSLAPFYRGKLRLAYATYRKTNGDGQKLETYQNDNVASNNAEREPVLYDFIKRTNGPVIDEKKTTPLVICATSTVSSRAVRGHYGTPALSVTFDPNRVTLHLPQDKRGVWLDYSAPTEVIDRLGRRMHKRMTTMLAVAISSAAVSPAMGRIRIGPTSMLLTFCNIRLGVWVANPRYAAQLEKEGLAPAEAELGYPRTGLGYLFKEFFGIHDLDDPYLYLTDGGHWENTGLVEMLRRSEITEIVCVDADSGPSDATNSIGKAIEIAPLECGVRIDISLDPLRGCPSTCKIPPYAPRTVNIGFVLDAVAEFEEGQPVGVVWYSKPGLTEDMPAELLAFHEEHPDYPRTSTLNQFFDTSTFVAYRDLGRYNAREILEARRRLLIGLEDLIGTATPEAKLKTLADGDDKHWVFAELRRVTSDLDSHLLKPFCRAVRTALVG